MGESSLNGATVIMKANSPTIVSGARTKFGEHYEREPERPCVSEHGSCGVADQGIGEEVVGTGGGLVTR